MDAREELSASLGVSKQAVSQVIDVLVNRGLLDRNTDPSDRRRITVGLTERGHEVVTAIWQGTEAISTASWRPGCRPRRSRRCGRG